MSVWVMSNKYEPFPMLKEIMEQMSSGRFISQNDREVAELHSAILANEENYILLLKDMGYELVCHPQYKFYYIRNMMKSSGVVVRNISIFIAVMLESNAHFESDIKNYTEFNLNTLPFLSNTNLVSKMDAAGIDSNNGLKTILNNLSRSGIVELDKKNSDLFVFQKPVYFYIDIYFKANQINHDYE